LHPHSGLQYGFIRKMDRLFLMCIFYISHCKYCTINLKERFPEHYTLYIILNHMKRNETKKAYVEPQIMMFALAGECPILAGSPPVNTNPTVVAPDEDDDDTNLVPEN